MAGGGAPFTLLQHIHRNLPVDQVYLIGCWLHTRHRASFSCVIKQRVYTCPYIQYIVMTQIWAFKESKFFDNLLTCRSSALLCYFQTLWWKKTQREYFCAKLLSFHTAINPSNRQHFYNLNFNFSFYCVKIYSYLHTVLYVCSSALLQINFIASKKLFVALPQSFYTVL